MKAEQSSHSAQSANCVVHDEHGRRRLKHSQVGDWFVYHLHGSFGITLRLATIHQSLSCIYSYMMPHVSVHTQFSRAAGGTLPSTFPTLPLWYTEEDAAGHMFYTVRGSCSCEKLQEKEFLKGTSVDTLLQGAHIASVKDGKSWS